MTVIIIHLDCVCVCVRVCVRSKVFVLCWWVSGPYPSISECSRCTWEIHQQWEKDTISLCVCVCVCVRVCVCVFERESEEQPPAAFCHPPLAPTSGPVSFTAGDCLCDGFLMPLTLLHTHSHACTYLSTSRYRNIYIEYSMWKPPYGLSHTSSHLSINIHKTLIHYDSVYDQ